jgi:hypothetical protein
MEQPPGDGGTWRRRGFCRVGGQALRPGGKRARLYHHQRCEHRCRKATGVKTESCNVDGRRLRIVSTDPSGVVTAETVLTLTQLADVVTGHYEGGAIVAGFLVGRLDAVGVLHFCYAQTDRHGSIDSGISTGILERTPDGRLRLLEHFQWLTRPERGWNVFEEDLAERNCDPGL